MRQVVFNAIVARYKRQHNKLDEVGFNCQSEEEYPKWLAHVEALQSGKITIEEYLTPLTDEQLLDVYDSQCCQDYR